MLQFNLPPTSGCRFACLALFALTVAVVPARAARITQGDVVFDNTPTISGPVAAGLQRYRGGSEARLLDWTSDGQLLVAVQELAQKRLLKIQAQPGQAAVAETLSLGGDVSVTVPVLAAQPFSSKSMAYLGEADHASGAALYVSPINGGEARLLANAAARPGSPVWAHDGHQLAFSATLRDGQNTDLYVVDTTSPAGPRLVAAGGANAWQVLGWTNADRALLVHHVVSSIGDELLLIDLATGAPRRVDTLGERAPEYGAIEAAALAPDNRGLYFLSRRGSEYQRLRYVDLYAESSADAGPKLNHDIEHFDLSASGQSMAYTWKENGYSRVALFDRKSGASKLIADFPPGSVAALKFDRGGTRLAIELAASTAPRDVYVYDLLAGVTTRWTDSGLGELKPAQWVAPQTTRFQTWDRLNGRARQLTAQLYRPRLPGRHAGLVLLRDADEPAGLQLDRFVQFCVYELGITVIVPDLRSGETGALDLGALLAWIGAQPDLLRDHIAVLGRGSGGTLALTGLGLYGDRLRAAVDIDGSASSAQLAPIRQPVLLVRGLHSPALDAGSAEQLLWRLRSTHVVSGMVAPREAMGLLRGDAEQMAAQQVIAQFLATALSD